MSNSRRDVQFREANGFVTSKGFNLCNGSISLKQMECQVLDNNEKERNVFKHSFNTCYGYKPLIYTALRSLTSFSTT